jgi:hydrogenase maturation protease
LEVNNLWLESIKRTNNRTSIATQSYLVIGYGNDLRSDDAVGQRVAEIVATWEIPNLRSLAIHQLTPELAANLADVDLAIFVDACEQKTSKEVQIVAIEPNLSGTLTAHSADPRSLLALTQAVYSRTPQALWVLIPGENFEVGDRLSPFAETSMAIGLERIQQLISKSKVKS